jgi:hypothetical protein
MEQERTRVHREAAAKHEALLDVANKAHQGALLENSALSTEQAAEQGRLQEALRAMEGELAEQKSRVRWA